MLYDILIIDDDFDNSSTKGSLAEESWKTNANFLLRKLIKDNLRVTWTSGEDHAQKMGRKDLSIIKYIFCDLEFDSSGMPFNYKAANSNLVAIFEKLLPKISADSVTIYINSLHSENYQERGKLHFESALKKEFEEEFEKEFRVILGSGVKNNLNKEQIKELTEHAIQIQLRFVVISKAIEVEEVMNKKLKLNSRDKRYKTFDTKKIQFKENFCLSKINTQKIDLLQGIRNNVAHKETANLEIKLGDKSLHKVFWKILDNGSGIDQPIRFEKFEDIVKYIESIDPLIEIMDNTKKKKSTKNKVKRTR